MAHLRNNLFRNIEAIDLFAVSCLLDSCIVNEPAMFNKVLSKANI